VQIPIFRGGGCVKKVKLGQLVYIQTGKLDANEAVPGGKYPFFTTAKEISCINEYAYDDEVVLVAGNGDLNVKYYKGKFNAYQRTYILTSNSNVRMKYLYYFLDKYIEVLRYQSIGGVIKYIKLNNLSDAQIPTRSTIEQDKIIRILEKLDNEIIIRNKQLSELSNLVKSRFNEMFGDPILNDMEWEVTKLGKLTNKISSGNTPKGGSQVYVDKGIMFFRSQNVWKNKILLDDIAYIDDQTNRNMKDTILEHGDLLITKTGRVNTENSSLGRTAQYLGQSGKANINGHVYLVRINSDISKRFILEILISNAYRDYIRRICVGGIDKRQLNKNHIEDFPIILPPLSLQNEFVDFVAQVDKSQFACQKAIKLWRNSLKSSII